MASATNISLECVVIPIKPHQPLSFNFPKRSFGHGKEFFSQVGLQNGLSSFMMNQKMQFFVDGV